MLHVLALEAAEDRKCGHPREQLFCLALRSHLPAAELQPQLLQLLLHRDGGQCLSDHLRFDLWRPACELKEIGGTTDLEEEAVQIHVWEIPHEEFQDLVALQLSDDSILLIEVLTESYRLSNFYMFSPSPSSDIAMSSQQTFLRMGHLRIS